MISLKEATLVAIANGAENEDEIARALSASKEVVRKVIEELKAEDYVREELKGFWIFRRKVLRLTEKGFELASKTLKKLESLRNEIVKKIKDGDEDYLNNLMVSWSYIIPLLVWMNMLDLLLLGNFIGLASEEFEDIEFGGEEVM